MAAAKITTLVIDTSVLPKRPEPLEVKEFLDKKVHIDWTLVKSIQLHNIKNVVLLGLKDETVAKQLASQHHLVHFISCVGKEIPIPIPIYEKSHAVDVRIHDLDEEIRNEEVISYLRQFGEVISIRDEVWKNFFPGFLNGVRVARMVIKKPIPSYANFRDQVTLITCGGKAHPKVLAATTTTTTTTTTKTATNKTSTVVATSEEYPALPTATMSKTIDSDKNKPKQKKDKLQQTNPSTSTPSLTSITMPPPAPIATKDNKKSQYKRQRSTEETAAASSKKSNTKDTETDTDTDNNSERGYDPYLDPKILFKEKWNSEFCNHLTDPTERKETVKQYVREVMALRKKELESKK